MATKNVELAHKFPATKVDLCTCKNDFQDATYGRGMRVYNICIMPKGLIFKGYRCTVCGVTRDT